MHVSCSRSYRRDAAKAIPEQCRQLGSGGINLVSPHPFRPNIIKLTNPQGVPFPLLLDAYELLAGGKTGNHARNAVQIYTGERVTWRPIGLKPCKFFRDTGVAPNRFHIRKTEGNVSVGPSPI